MTTTRKRYSAKFKSRAAVEVIRGEKTLSQLAAQFQVHPVQIAQSKKSPWSNCENRLWMVVLDRLGTVSSMPRHCTSKSPAEDGAGVGEKKASLLG